MPTVLVVDDSAIDRRLAGGLLENRVACDVQFAGDGKEALQYMAQVAPDLVLTDLQMPEMNGLELLAAVKRDYPFVPVVLMTAQGSEDLAAEALRRGAASYVPKRRLAEDLPLTIQRVLLDSIADRAPAEVMHYLETCESRFDLESDPSLIKALVQHVQQLLRCLPLGDEMERLRVGVALEEALLNAYYHGNLEVGAARSEKDRLAREQLVQVRLSEPPYRDRRIHVTVRVSRNEAVFVVRDDGPGFDVSRLPAGTNLPDDERDSGRGVVLMRTIMDEVRYNAAGSEVTLVKRRTPEEPYSGPEI
jgi:CheY-like chemotaxis protein